MTTPDRPVVLVVQDEAVVSDTQIQIPSDRYEIRTATNTSDALQRSDGVDAILIDRALSAADPDDVLAALRDHGAGCRAAILAEDAPEFDVIETGFDDYVTKPLSRDALCETIDDMITREEYASKVEEYHDLLSKQAELEAETENAELVTSEEYVALGARIDDLQTDLEAANDRLLDDAEFVGTLREVTGEPNADTTEGFR